MAESSFANDYLKGNPQPTLMIKYLLFLRRIGFKPRVVYDVGAYDTSFANLISEIFPDVRVILFDASKERCDKITEYECYNYCLGDTASEIDFYELNDNDKVKSYYKPKTFVDADDKVSKIVVETLDVVATKKGLPFPDLVRIDCCGAERDVIAGGKLTLQLAKYLIVSLQNEEFFMSAPLAITSGPVIKSLGYEIKDILDLYNTPLIEYIFENKSL
jgi:FkbM family methyltransferase